MNLSKVKSYIFPALLLLLAVFLWPKIMDFCGYALAVLRYPFVWAMTENENLLAIDGLVRGVNVYPAQPSETYFYFVYPPIFHALAAVFIKIFGFSVFIPRLISIFAIIGIIFLLGLFFREKRTEGQNWLLTLVLAGVFVSLAPYAQYYVLARVDMLAYAFALASLFFAWQIIYKKANVRANCWSAGGLALAALLTKQSAFFPYLTLAALIVIVPDKKEWLRFGLWLGLATIASVAILQMITGGFVQSLHLASQIYGDYLNSSQHLFRLQTTFFNQYWPLFLSVAALIGITTVSVIKRQENVSFSLIVMVTIYLNFLFTGGNQGAEFNTMIPVLLGLLLVAKELGNREHLGSSFLVGLIALQLIVLHRFSLPYTTPTETDASAQSQLIATLKASKQASILGDRVDFAILKAGKRSVLEASTYNVQHDWSQTEPDAMKTENELLTRLQNHKIDTAVVTITGFGKAELLSYIENYGELIETLTISYMDAPQFPHRVYRFNQPIDSRETWH